MTKSTLAEKATEHAVSAYGIPRPLVLDHAQAKDPSSAEVLHRFRIVGADAPNGRTYSVFLDAHGRVSPATRVPDRVFDGVHLATAAPAPIAPITISPATNVLTLNPGEVLDETITVTVPKNGGTARADIYFLADTTGSMESILAAVQAGATSMLTALAGLGDIAFGVGNYRDFQSGDAYGFQHQLNPTPGTGSAAAAIAAWTLGNGGDKPEASLFALQQLAEPPGGSIGWRTSSKRIIVWFGDAAGHDPVCAAASGTATDVTEASATTALVKQNITVLAASTATPGLDEDPVPFGGYAVCGAPGGLAGQATRITAATGGMLSTGVDAASIVNTIVSLVSGAIAGINNLKLVPSAGVAPFVTSITPSAGYGPLAGDSEHVLKFEVRFTGIPCKPEAQVATGTLDVVADDVVVTQKRVQITVPPCRPKLRVYSVKFVCGAQASDACGCQPLQPGAYATEINIHNYTPTDAKIRARFIPLVLAGAPVGREPRTAEARALDALALPPQSATMLDCCRILESIYGAKPTAAGPITLGFVEITSTVELAITAVYTASGSPGGPVSIQVEQISAQAL